tara:strand:- start:115 stop:825 length:711 start_codon:yes stop_codon:yes gene_type:complete
MALTKLKSSGIADGAVTATDIADETITVGKISGNAAASADTFLKKDGTWATVSTTSDIELLNTYEPSDVASVEVNTAAYFTSPYKALKFQLINMHPITDNVHLRMYFGVGDPVDYTGASFDTNFGIMQSNGSTNWWQYEASYGGSGNWDSTFATLFKEVGNGTAEMCSGDVTITGSDSSTFFKTYQGMFTGRLYHSYVLTCFTAGVWDDQPAFTSIKFQFNSGNIDTGIIKVYGLR